MPITQDTPRDTSKVKQCFLTENANDPEGRPQKLQSSQAKSRYTKNLYPGANRSTIAGPSDLSSTIGIRQQDTVKRAGDAALKRKEERERRQNHEAFGAAHRSAVSAVSTPRSRPGLLDIKKTPAKGARGADNKKECVRPTRDRRASSSSKKKTRAPPTEPEVIEILDDESQSQNVSALTKVEDHWVGLADNICQAGGYPRVTKLRVGLNVVKLSKADSSIEMKWYKRHLDHDEKGEAILSLEVPNWIGGSKCQVLINLSQEIESLVLCSEERGQHFVAFRHKTNVPVPTSLRELGNGEYRPESKEKQCAWIVIETEQWQASALKLLHKKLLTFRQFDPKVVPSRWLQPWEACSEPPKRRSTRSRSNYFSETAPKRSIRQKPQRSAEDAAKAVLTWPSPGEKGAVTITNGDVDRLEEGEFLNDVIVNFFLMYLHKKELDSHDPTLKDNVHIFSTFFYKKLTSGGRKDSDLSQGFAKVKSWTKTVNIFEKKFLFVPICENAHWYLAVICNPGMRKDQAVVMIDDEPIVVDGSPRKEKLPLGEPCVVEASADIGDDGLVDVSNAFATPVKTSKKAVETFSALKKMESSQPHAVAMEADNETGVSADEDIDEEQNQAVTVESEDEEGQEGGGPKLEELDMGMHKHITETDAVGMVLDILPTAVDSPDECNDRESPELKSIEDEQDNQGGLLNFLEDEQKTKTPSRKRPAQDSMGKDVETLSDEDTLRKTRSGKKPQRSAKRPRQDKAKPKPIELLCTDRPCILAFDSLGTNRARLAVVKNLRKYLKQAWEDQKAKNAPDSPLPDRTFDEDDFRAFWVQAPTQDNFCDCGVFVLKYVMKFLGHSQNDFEKYDSESVGFPNYVTQDLNSKYKEWFPREEISDLRRTIKTLIQHLSGDVKPELGGAATAMLEDTQASEPSEATPATRTDVDGDSSEIVAAAASFGGPSHAGEMDAAEESELAAESAQLLDDSPTEETPASAMDCDPQPEDSLNTESVYS
eukprot:m.167931 g.167931  ORF g.167931 m.167931 type:complete len:993 (-) comp14738_c0_seq7:91-3069(-)